MGGVSDVLGPPLKPQLPGAHCSDGGMVVTIHPAPQGLSSPTGEQFAQQINTVNSDKAPLTQLNGTNCSPESSRQTAGPLRGELGQLGTNPHPLISMWPGWVPAPDRHRRQNVATSLASISAPPPSTPTHL